MGTWISHLRIAESLLAEVPGLDPALFGFGNLAPDSGVPNADWSQFDPPKTVTHFLKLGEDEGQIADAEFYHNYLHGADRSRRTADFSFRLGFFFHLLCDNLWALRLGRRIKQEFAALLAERGADGWWLMKKDWYDLDHLYLRDHPDSLFWRELLHAPQPAGMLDFIPDAAMRHSWAYIRRLYSEPKERDLDRAYPYLNPAAMDTYVADSTQTVLQVWRCLEAGAPLAESGSALAMLGAGAVAPYEFPIADSA